MEKRGMSWMFIGFLAAIIAIVGSLAYLWIGAWNESPAQNYSSQGSQANNSNVNETITPPSEENNSVPEVPDNYVPPPKGGINWIDKEEPDGGYFCNNESGSEHQIKLYTYKVINREKVLSGSFIESEETKNICRFYSNASVDAGVRYNMEWSWTPIADITGYRIYQRYNYGNITREYDYYIELPAIAFKLIDTNPNLWSEVQNSS